MKGNNELILNEATLIQAVQEWIDKRMGEHAPIVKSVKSNGHYDGFKIGLAEKITV